MLQEIPPYGTYVHLQHGILKLQPLSQSKSQVYNLVISSSTQDCVQWFALCILTRSVEIFWISIDCGWTRTRDLQWLSWNPSILQCQTRTMQTAASSTCQYPKCHPTIRVCPNQCLQSFWFIICPPALTIKMQERGTWLL